MTTSPIASDPLVVATASGPVRGRATAHGAVFHSIPYAAPPAGALRFSPPLPPQSWSDVRDATYPRATAPQPVRGMFGVLDMSPYFGPGWVRGADYLTVDVRTTSASDGPAPVMVFIHGGGFVAGSPQAPLYTGDAFARDGVVLVSVGYRLGIAGFLRLPDTPDNRGLLDVIAALRWVQDNIAAFGGDPANVTVFGQSAGAILLGGLLTEPSSRGLVRRAVIQSGSGTAVLTPEQGRRVAAAIGAALDVEPTAAALSDVSDQRLVDSLGALAGIDLDTAYARDPLPGVTPFGLVLPDTPADRIAAGHGHDVDLLVGSTTDEGGLYLAPTGQLDTTTEKDLIDTAGRFHDDPVAAVESARAANPAASLSRLRTFLLSEGLFRAGTRRTADAHATSSAGTYAYEFAWRPDAVGGQLGACHTIELPFVFDMTGLPALHGPTALLGTTPAPAELACDVHTAWVRFASTGDPGWAPYRTETRHTHRFGDALS
ncbi:MULTISPECIES: carboxylesterase/lipase family protein [Streptomyces]|uniref:carboxylesterase/lipase family protein n=1 Tax=Streptomyces TaxID=1883 RepID=UPI003F4DC2E1